MGFVLAIPLAMMLEASLSFLGIGVPPPLHNWGQMINVGLELNVLLLASGGVPDRRLCHHYACHHPVWRCGLRDALDPTLKGC